MCVSDSSTFAEASVDDMRKNIESDSSSLIALALTLTLFQYPQQMEVATMMADQFTDIPS